MSTPEEDGKATSSDRGLRKLKGPMTAVLAFLLALGSVYFLYVKEKVDYMGRRNFRLLATMGRQVNEAVASQGKVLQSLAKLSGGSGTLSKGQVSPDLKLRILKDCAGSINGAASGRDIDQGTISQPLESAPDGYRLRFHFAAGAKNLCGSVELQELLEPLFLSRQAFDSVLLADEHGEVIYQHGPPEISIHRLNLLLEKEHLLKPPNQTGA